MNQYVADGAELIRLREWITKMRGPGFGPASHWRHLLDADSPGARQ